MNYKVDIRVLGHVMVDVKASSKEEAIKIAEAIFSEADCGELTNVDGGPYSIESDSNFEYLF